MVCINRCNYFAEPYITNKPQIEKLYQIGLSKFFSEENLWHLLYLIN